MASAAAVLPPLPDPPRDLRTSASAVDALASTEVNPQHAKAYRNFAEEYRRLQRERIAAFSEYIADVQQGRFPERRHLVEMDDVTLQSVIAELGGPAA